MAEEEGTTSRYQSNLQGEVESASLYRTLADVEGISSLHTGQEQIYPTRFTPPTEFCCRRETMPGR